MFIESLAPSFAKSDDNPQGVDAAGVAGVQNAILEDRYTWLSGLINDFLNLEDYQGKRVSEGTVRAMWNAGAEAGAYATWACPPGWLADFSSDITHIDIPTLIIHGTADRILPIDGQGRRLHAALPAATYVEIEGGPHLGVVTHADEINTALLSFLADTPATPRTVELITGVRAFQPSSWCRPTAGRYLPGSAVTVHRCCCCTATRRPISCGMPPRSCWPSSTRSLSSTFPATARRFGQRRRRIMRHTPSAPLLLTSSRSCGSSATRAGRSPATIAVGASPTGWRWTTPTRVTAAAAFDVVPTGEVWARADAQLALLYWHWSFLAQPAPLPERLIGADPGAFFDYHVRALGIGVTPGRYPDALVSAYRDLLDDPSTVEAICEDYRAGATIDRDHDDADLGKRKIHCPLLLLWSGRGALPRLYGDVLEVWRPWAEHVTGRGLDATHFLVEDQPEEVAKELLTLLSSRPSS